MSYIIGPLASKTRIKDLAPVFYLRLELRQGNRRDRADDAGAQERPPWELDLGSSGKKPEFKSEAMRPFDSIEIGPQLFRITTAKLTPGEYIFFQIGSAEPPKWQLRGRVSDFRDRRTSASCTKKLLTTSRTAGLRSRGVIPLFSDRLGRKMIMAAFTEES